MTPSLPFDLRLLSRAAAVLAATLALTGALRLDLAGPVTHEQMAAGNAIAPAPAAAPSTAVNDGLAAYAELPLAFAPTSDGERAAYVARGPGYAIGFTRSGVILNLIAEPRRAVALSLDLIGASPAVLPDGVGRGAARVSTLRGSDPSAWRTGVPSFTRVVYRDAWPGIDAVFEGTGKELKYSFRVRPGASVADIRLAYRGVSGFALTRQGSLALETAVGRLSDARPVAYQRAGGTVRAIPTRFVLEPGSRNRFGFDVGPGYDRTRPLLIDPAIVYSTVISPVKLGGFSVAAGADGSAYVSGSVGANLNTTPGAYDPSFNGIDDYFVSKFDATGSTLLYSTFIGGSASDGDRALAGGTGIAVADGFAYITGSTLSSDFPTTRGAFDRDRARNEDAFVAKLNRAGSDLVYSTFLGGRGADFGDGIAIDAEGNAYVTGHTDSPTYPTTPSAYAPTFDVFGDSAEAFVTKLNPAGSRLVYSTFLGGGSDDMAKDIAVDADGAAYVVGWTWSFGFPTTEGAYDETEAPRDGTEDRTDGFVTKFDPTGSALVYSTFLGGTGFDYPSSIAVDADGSAYVAGFTQARDFPTTAGAYDRAYNGGWSDAFVTKLAPTGASLVYSTYLGGNKEDRGFLAIDSAGNAYVTGWTQSTTFPTTSGRRSGRTAVASSTRSLHSSTQAAPRSGTRHISVERATTRPTRSPPIARGSSISPGTSPLRTTPPSGRSRSNARQRRPSQAGASTERARVTSSAARAAKTSSRGEAETTSSCSAGTTTSAPEVAGGTSSSERVVKMPYSARQAPIAWWAGKAATRSSGATVETGSTRATGNATWSGAAPAGTMRASIRSTGRTAASASTAPNRPPRLLADLEHRQQHEEDSAHRERSVQRHHRNGEVLLGRHARRFRRRGGRGADRPVCAGTRSRTS